MKRAPHLPDRDLALCYLRCDARATGHNARERDTDERRDGGGDRPAPTGSRPADYIAHVGNIGYNARERDAGERRDAGREWNHLPDRGQAATRCLTDFEA